MDFQDYQAAKISHSINQKFRRRQNSSTGSAIVKGVEQMKIYVSCDIEGLAGIATFDMEKDTVLFRELYHQHVAWLIEGIQRVPKMNKLQKLLLPIRKPWIEFSLCALGEMDERISLVSGFPRMDYMMSGLDSSYDVVFS